MLDQTKAPIIQTLKSLTQKSHAPFYAPGHKQGKGIPQPLNDLLGKKVFLADLPELPELDNLFAPESVIKEAQELAAETFGALQTKFLVNGSTTGIIAGIIATCGNGDKIILPRNIHQSVVSGLIISGAIPIFIHPEYDSDWDIALSITPESIAQTLAKHPDAKAVMVIYPTYHGVCGDIAAIAQEVHKYNIPLLVDEAHGPHFAFHPELPTPALVGGADLTVQSIHKVLGAMTQASMLHLGSKRIDSYRLSQALQMLQSSSPNYLLLASLDAARQQMALFGQELMSQTLELARDARNRISQLPNFSVFDKEIRSLTNSPGNSDLLTNNEGKKLPFSIKGRRNNGMGYKTSSNYRYPVDDGVLYPEDRRNNSLLPSASCPLPFPINSGFVALDQTRLTVKVSDIDLSGYEADEILHQKLGVTCELPSFKSLAFIISLGNTKADIDQLIDALVNLAEQNCRNKFNQLTDFKTEIDDYLIDSSIPFSPRDAFFAQKDYLPIEKSLGCISAELICPYPPGIPVLMPGEIITQQHLKILEQVRALGGIITGCSDPTLKTIKVCRY
ncbi:MAG: aminotransferase class I/II-fold pyridoxal phosphate-dependent enzyme [Okeania sp. SIO3B5]|uniref:aminotransferase class I/II-fold pyridoxal phosphate-dependent enzyme n=1 Tax=Okeania sp. SIO3B5 TaxID=2607811 RepID=UPI001400742C|nr:aminotransferase class I/II-fold pyridoxal phosphate-dependent enzyme [Okeania sp. SIO3B5]NEO56274.1 aminotransferase class I/II-fold pyridoxal phosphate-dependent enzyme [Okeania sp. SIO3B5]